MVVQIGQLGLPNFPAHLPKLVLDALAPLLVGKQQVSLQPVNAIYFYDRLALQEYFLVLGQLALGIVAPFA